MNNENNNLNGVVLGNVSNEVPSAPSVNSGDSVMANNPGNVVVPESNVVTPEQQVVNSQVIAEPTISIPNEEVVNPQPINTVVMPTEASATQNVQPQPVSNPVSTSVPPVQPSATINQTSTPTPQPAYTSVNSINPMPGFENNIGTNPPISLENDKAPKKKGNNVLFIIIVVLLLLGVAFGTYYVLNYTDLLSKKETITITTNNLVYNVGEELSENIEDYATIKGTSSSNCTFNIDKVDTAKEGLYKYTVTCSNITKEGNITVIDNTELVLNTQTAYYVKGDTAEAKDFVKNPLDTVEYSFVDANEVNNILNGDVGSYTVKIKAVSDNGKEATSDAKLVITQYRIKGYISCSNKEQTIDNYVMEKVTKLAIIEDGNNGFGNIGFDIYTFRYNNESDYQDLVNEYNESKEIKINEITGIPEFDDENKKITITNEVESTVLYNTYGLDNLKDYSSIRTYFTQTLNYNCSYEKANA